jgi:hypothetical protein
MSRAAFRPIRTMTDPKGDVVAAPRKRYPHLNRDGSPAYESCHFMIHGEGRLSVRCDKRRVKHGLCATHLQSRDAIATFNREHATRRVVKRWVKNHLVRTGDLSGRGWRRFRRANRATVERLISIITKARATKRPTMALS